MEIALPKREYDRSVNSEIERLLYQNSVILMDAKGLTSGVDDAQLNWTAGKGAWSANQCLEHLNITHRLWQPILEKAIDSAKAREVLSDGPYSYGFFSRLFLRMAEPPAKLRIKTTAPFRPAGELAAQTLIAEFEERHERLNGTIRSANGLDLARIRVRSAFSKYVRFSLGMAFWILLAHDRRHIWQARQMLQRAGSAGEAAGAASSGS